jgi:hypothetical protein
VISGGLSEPVNNKDVHRIEGPGYSYQTINRRLIDFGVTGWGKRSNLFSKYKETPKYWEEGEVYGEADVGTGVTGISPSERRQKAQQKKNRQGQGAARKFKRQNIRALMNYAVYFYNNQALHEGYAEEGSLACVHVPEPPIRQINYYTVPEKAPVSFTTTVTINYDSSPLLRLCCAEREAAAKNQDVSLSTICSNNSSDRRCQNQISWFDLP